MLITNFAIDAPLTKCLTNLFVKKVNEYEKNKLDKYTVNHPQNASNSSIEANDVFIPKVTIENFINRKEAK
jgi:hypothetical protein